MTKHLTSELTGALLDAAVALAEGLRPSIFQFAPDAQPLCAVEYAHEDDPVSKGSTLYCPSTNWAIAGPIIDRERISMRPRFYDPGVICDEPSENPRYWQALCWTPARAMFPPITSDPSMVGPTPLVAAMRAYVGSKFGAEVELP